MHMLLVFFWHLSQPLRPPYITVSGFGLTQCILLSSIPLATMLQSRVGRDQGGLGGEGDRTCSDAYLVEHVTKARRFFIPPQVTF